MQMQTMTLAAADRLGEGGERAGGVGGRVGAEKEQRVRLVPILEVAGAHTGTDRSRERPARRLVAHIRAVGHVVRAEGATELIEILDYYVNPEPRV